MATSRLLSSVSLFSSLDGPVSRNPQLSRFSSQPVPIAAQTATEAPLPEAPIVVIRDVEVQFPSLRAIGDEFRALNRSLRELENVETFTQDSQYNVSANTSVSYYAEQNNEASDTVPPYMQHMTLILVILHMSVFITGLVGNSLVCLSVYRNKSLQTVTNYYIVNLAVADFLVILICLPPTVYWDLTLTWNFGLVLCKMVLYLQSISVSVSVLTLTCISIDRWYAICRPLEFSSTKYRAKITIVLIWIVSMLIASPDAIFLTTRPLYQENDYVYTDCTYSWPESSTKMYQLCIVTLLFVGPFVLMSISYSHIVNVLWRNETMADSMQQSITLEEEQQSLKRKNNEFVSVAEQNNYPPDNQVPTKRILTLELDSPEASERLDDTQGSKTHKKQRGRTKQSSLLLRDLSGAKFAHGVCSCKDQVSILSSSNYSEQAESAGGGGKELVGEVNIEGARNKIAQANLPSINVQLIATQCTTPESIGLNNEQLVRDGDDSIGAAKEVECGITSITAGPNQSYEAKAVPSPCLTSPVSTSAPQASHSDQCDGLDKNEIPDILTALGPNEPGVIVEDKEEVGRKRKDKVVKKVDKYESHAINRQTLHNQSTGPELSARNSTSTALLGSSSRTTGGEELVSSGRKVASHCRSQPTSLTEAGTPKEEDSSELIVNSLCRKIGTAGREDCSSEANSKSTSTTLIVKNSLSPPKDFEDNDSCERAKGTGLEFESANSKGFKVSYSKVPSASVYVNITGPSESQQKVMNCNDEVSSTNVKQQGLKKLKTEKKKRNQESCCICLLKSMKHKEVRLVGSDKTTKKYRKNLANYAAKKDRYREVVITGRGPRQALLLSLDATGSTEVRKEESADLPEGNNSKQQQRQLSLNMGSSLKSTLVDSSPLTHSGTRSGNLVDFHSEGNHRGGAANSNFNQHHPSSKTRFYKLIESRKKAAKMLIVIVIMFGLCYLPVHFLNILRYTIGLPQNDITTIASLVSHWLCYFNSAVNPLIYNFMSGKFRHEFANLFFCKCFGRRNGS